MNMGLILDLIFVAIFVISIIVTAKKGFINSVIGVVAFAVSIFIAISISGPIAESLYTNFIREPVSDSVQTVISNTVTDAEADAAEKIDAFYESLPDFVENFVETEGISSEEIINTFSDSTLDAAELSNTLLTNVVDPALITLLNYILVIVFSIVLSIIARLLSKLITSLIKGNIIGKANSVLGGVLGAISGAFIVIIVYLIVSLLSNSLSIVPLTEAISTSHLCDILANIFN